MSPRSEYVTDMSSMTKKNKMWSNINKRMNEQVNEEQKGCYLVLNTHTVSGAGGPPDHIAFFSLYGAASQPLSPCHRCVSVPWAVLGGRMHRTNVTQAAWAVSQKRVTFSSAGTYWQARENLRSGRVLNSWTVGMYRPIIPGRCLLC